MIMFNDISAATAIYTTSSSNNMNVPLGRQNNAVIVAYFLSDLSTTPSQPVWKFGGSSGTTMSQSSTTYHVTETSEYARLGIAYIFSATPSASAINIYKASHTTGAGWAGIWSISNGSIDASSPMSVSNGNDSLTALSNATNNRRGISRFAVLVVDGSSTSVTGIGGCSSYKSASMFSTAPAKGMILYGQNRQLMTDNYGGSWSGTKQYSAIGLAVNNSSYAVHPFFL